MSIKSLPPRLRTVVIGHVDHGKSTLIGHLLCRTGSISKERLIELRQRSLRQNKTFQYAYLLDALREEQEQNITMDLSRVAMSFDHQTYEFLDAPGHAQYVRSMVTGATRADAALLLIDATTGVAQNTYLHLHLISMFGLKQIVVFINKMDQVNWDSSRFERIRSECTELIRKLGLPEPIFVPGSALLGINLVGSTPPSLSWYQGPSLMDALRQFKCRPMAGNDDFRMYIQDVYPDNKAAQEVILVGMVASGTVSLGDCLHAGLAGSTATVDSILYRGKEVSFASAEQSIALRLNPTLELARGDLLFKKTQRPPILSQAFKVKVFWVSSKNFDRRKTYSIRIGTAKYSARSISIDNVLDPMTMSHRPTSRGLCQGLIGTISFEFQAPHLIDTDKSNFESARAVIVDQYEIVAGGLVEEALPAEETL